MAEISDELLERLKEEWLKGEKEIAESESQADEDPETQDNLSDPSQGESGNDDDIQTFPVSERERSIDEAAQAFLDGRIPRVGPKRRRINVKPLR